MVLFAAQPADRLADLANLVGVQSGRRLVEDQHVRLVQQHLGHADALPIALGELADRLADHVPQVAQIDDRRDRAAAYAPCMPRASAKNSSSAPRRHVRDRAGRFPAGSPTARRRRAGRSAMSWPAMQARPADGDR